MTSLALNAASAYGQAILKNPRHRSAAAAPQIAAWLLWLQGVKNLRPASVDAYEKRVDPLLGMFPDTPFADFTPEHLDALLAATKDGSKHPTRTALVSLFRAWGYARELIAKDPTRLLGEMKAPKQHYQETFSDAEVEALIGLPGEDGFRMLLMLDTGLRISELCNLRVRDMQILDIDRGQVIVLDGKGGNDRVVPMTKRLLTAFARWQQLEAAQLDEFMFGHYKPGGHEGTLHRALPLSHDALRKWFYERLKIAGVRRLKPHTTRHTFATRLIRNGAPILHVSKYLGHKNIETTISCYTHLVTEDLRLSIELLEV